MEKKMKRVWVAATTIVVLIATMAFWAHFGWGVWSLLASANLMIVLAVFSLLLYSFQRMKEEEKSGFPIKDERTVSLEERADSRAFNLGMWFMVALMFLCLLWAEFQRRQEYLPALIMLILSLCVMTGARFFFRHHLSKGEA